MMTSTDRPYEPITKPIEAQNLSLSHTLADGAEVLRVSHQIRWTYATLLRADLRVVRRRYEHNKVLTVVDDDAEQALLVTMYYVHRGQVRFRAVMRHKDLLTGKTIDPPELYRVAPLGQPCRGIPNEDGEWWNVLLERGWLELSPPADSEASYYRVSAEGRQVLEPLLTALKLPNRPE